MDSNPQTKNSKNVCTDRISDLPDLILEKILSFLPTKNAVASCILSKRWMNVFPFGFPLIKLDLDDSLLFNPKGNESRSNGFVRFVDKLLNETLRDVSCVERLTLKCETHYAEAKIISWICAAVRLNVQELLFECILMKTEAGVGALFHTLNGCTSLTRLELKDGNFKRVPSKFSLPRLKTLDIFYAIFNDDDDYFGTYDNDDDDDEVCGSVIKTLMDGCPSLEKLSLIHCNLEDVHAIHIESKLLKTLHIYDSLGPSCLVTILTPNLEELMINDCSAYDCTISHLRSLSRAIIDVGPSQRQLNKYSGDYYVEEPWYFESVSQLVHGCCDTIELHLATRTMETLHRSIQQLPTFQNLTLLCLACVNGSDGWVFLAHVLFSAPCLQKLIFEEEFKSCEDGYSKFESVVSLTPYCLEFHLKEIEIWLYKEQEDEVKLIEYFVKNGKVLQTFTIYSSVS